MQFPFVEQAAGQSGSAAGQRLRHRVDASMPQEKGAWALRFVPKGAEAAVDGDRPTSRGLPPAARDGGARERPELRAWGFSRGEIP